MPKEKDLEKLKKLEEQLEKKKAALLAAKGQIKERERKEKVKRYIKIGSLAEAAEIHTEDDSALLGAFLRVKELLKNPSDSAKLKAEGEKLLAAK